MKRPKPLKLSLEIREQLRRNVESLVAETFALLRPPPPPKPATPKPPRVVPKPRGNRSTRR